MPRGFAGSGDYSSLFGSLYQGARAKVKAEQDAHDSDMADKWANGLITDDEWLQYIQERVRAESADPKRQTKWIEAYRKYSVAIGDSKAEFAFQNGGSIHELIAYYEGRLGDMAKDSNEYRDVALRVNELRDKRSSESIASGEDALMDKIDAGKAKWSDLVRFYREQKKALRPGSDLSQQLDERIDKVQDRISQNKIEGDLEKIQYEFEGGKISGKTFASRVRAIAQTFKDTDPQRYYSLLASAQRIEKQNPGKYGTPTGRVARGSSGGSGGGSGSSGGSSKALNASVDAMQATRNNLQAIIDQFESGRHSGYDPMTGAAITFNEQVVADLDRQLLKAFDGITAAYIAKKDWSAATGAQRQKANYIVSNIAEHNTLFKEEEAHAMLVSTSKRLQGALMLDDPSQTAAIARDVAADYEKWVGTLTTRQEKSASFAGDENRRLPAEEGDMVATGPKDALELPEPDFLGRHAAIANALVTVTTEGIDEGSAQAILDGLDGAFGEEFATDLRNAVVNPALEANGRAAGYAAGEVAPIIADGQTLWVPKKMVTQTTLDPMGNLVEVSTPVPDLARVGIQLDPSSQKLVDVFIDVNGKPAKRQAIGELATIGEAWHAASNITLPDGRIIPAGAVVPDSLYDQVPPEQRTKLERNAVRELAYISTVINGEKWVQDPGTSLWYKDHLPVRGLQLRPDGTVKIGDDGRPVLDWRAYASEAGVPAPYAGKDPRAMQALLDAGIIDTRDVRNRGLNGEVEPAAIWNGSTAYFDPFHIAPAVDARDSWWKEDERRQKSENKLRAEMAKAQTQARHRDEFLKANLEPEEYEAQKRRELLGDVVQIGQGAGRVLDQSGFGTLLTTIGRAFGLSVGTPPARGDIGSAAKDSRKPPVPAPTTLKPVTIPPGLKAELPEQTFSGPDLKADIDITLPKPAVTSTKPVLASPETLRAAEERRRQSGVRITQPPPADDPTITRPGASGLA